MLSANKQYILVFSITVGIITVVSTMFLSRTGIITKSSQPVFISGAIISGSFDQRKLKSDREWKEILSPEQFYILREKGTEIPFTGALDHETRPGTYYSAGCNEPVFSSQQKFDSKTGWPSFWAPITNDALVLREDRSLGDVRVEVLDLCGGHLGHVFEDGPQPTGKRYCINSKALIFKPDTKN